MPSFHRITPCIESHLHSTAPCIVPHLAYNHTLHSTTPCIVPHLAQYHTLHRITPYTGPHLAWRCTLSGRPARSDSPSAAAVSQDTQEHLRFVFLSLYLPFSELSCSSLPLTWPPFHLPGSGTGHPDVCRGTRGVTSCQHGPLLWPLL